MSFTFTLMKQRLKYLYIPLLLIGFACSSTSNISSNQQKGPKLSQKDKMKSSALYVDGIRDKNLGNIEKAIKNFEECIKVNPQDAAALYELSALYLSYDRNEEAEELAKRAVDIEPTNEWYRVMLSNAYKLNTKFVQSNAILAQLHKERPNNLDYAQELIVGYVMTEEFPKSIEVLNHVEQKMGVTEQVALQKQQLYVKMDSIDAAVHEIEKLINIYPFESRYYAILAEFCLKHKMDEKAIAAYEKIVELDPENAYIHISLFDYYRKKENRTKAYEELKKGMQNPQLDLASKFQFIFSFYSTPEFNVTYRSESMELMQILMNVHPDNLQAKAIYADLLNRDQKPDEAMAIVQDLLIAEPLNYAYQELELLIIWSKQDFELLNSKSKTIIQKHPVQALPYYLLGASHFILEDYENALVALMKGQKLAINNEGLLSQFYAQIGDTQHELDRPEEAYEYYKKALAIDENNSTVLNNYAYYLSIAEMELDKALEMSSKAVDLDPYNSSNLDTKAWVLFKMNRYEEAREWIEKAIKLDTESNAEVLEHYGDILYKLGSANEALEQWKKASDKGDASEQLKNKIKTRKLDDSN